MDFKSILLAQKTGYIPRNQFDALFARRIGGAVLKDFPGLPASIVTVTDALAKPLDSLKVAITPVQSGRGDPSPDNIRPISGWTECNVVVSPTTDAEDGTTYPITFPSEAGAVYGGELDVVNGTLTVDRETLTFDGSERWISTDAGGTPYAFINVDTKQIYLDDTEEEKNSIFSHYQTAVIVTGNENVGARAFFSSGQKKQRICVRQEIGMTTTELKAYLAEQYSAGTPVQACIKLAEPITYQLTPTEVQMLLGTNNLWADTGDILEGKYYGKRSSETRQMLNTLRDTGEITPEEPEEPEENDER